jgi:hypothetical protein
MPATIMAELLEAVNKPKAAPEASRLDPEIRETNIRATLAVEKNPARLAKLVGTARNLLARFQSWAVAVTVHEPSSGALAVALFRNLPSGSPPSGP